MDGRRPGRSAFSVYMDGVRSSSSARFFSDANFLVATFDCVCDCWYGLRV